MYRRCVDIDWFFIDFQRWEPVYVTQSNRSFTNSRKIRYLLLIFLGILHIFCNLLSFSTWENLRHVVSECYTLAGPPSVTRAIYNIYVDYFCTPWLSKYWNDISYCFALWFCVCLCRCRKIHWIAAGNSNADSRVAKNSSDFCQVMNKMMNQSKNS